MRWTTVAPPPCAAVRPYTSSVTTVPIAQAGGVPASPGRAGSPPWTTVLSTTTPCGGGVAPARRLPLTGDNRDAANRDRLCGPGRGDVRQRGLAELGDELVADRGRHGDHVVPRRLDAAHAQPPLQPDERQHQHGDEQEQPRPDAHYDLRPARLARPVPVAREPDAYLETEASSTITA